MDLRASIALIRRRIRLTLPHWPIRCEKERKDIYRRMETKKKWTSSRSHNVNFLWKSKRQQNGSPQSTRSSGRHETKKQTLKILARIFQFDSKMSCRVTSTLVFAFTHSFYRDEVETQLFYVHFALPKNYKISKSHYDQIQSKVEKRNASEQRRQTESNIWMYTLYLLAHCIQSQ